MGRVVGEYRAQIGYIYLGWNASLLPVYIMDVTQKKITVVSTVIGFKCPHLIMIACCCMAGTKLKKP